jgi:predicted Ser/Thr protein kinase
MPDRQRPLDRPAWVPKDLFPQTMLLAAGSRLGPYEIHSLLGSGGMGQVYRATDTRLGRAVAIKILRPEIATDTAFRARFDREARMISRLDHPNICTLYDVGEDRGTAFLVMQYLEGSPLSRRIDSGPTPADEVIRVGISLASALTYAHGRGILHRDIKPQNVIVLGDQTIKLVDFGIAKSYGANPNGTSADTNGVFTTTGVALGTPSYMSPEQLSGRDLDGRSDIFSLGVLMYELASGSHPFRRETPALTAAAILNARYPGLPSTSGKFGDLDPILSRMLARVPADRYPTIGDCLADLRQVEERTIPAAAANGSSRRRFSWGLATFGGAAAVIAVVLVSNRSEQPSPAPTRTAPTAGARAAGSDRDDLAQAIVAAAFLKARPAAAQNGGAPLPTYRPVDGTLPQRNSANVSEVGVTVWRLRRAAATDTTRLLVHQPQGGVEQWTPERIEAGTPLQVGDRVRFSIEFPRDGYLYVIDREQYADGSTSEPYLIFPTTRTRSGDNKVTGGRLIEIPAQTDAPPYLTLQRTRADQVAERITVLISQLPLPNVVPGPAPIVLGRSEVAAWEKRGGSMVNELEMIGGAGRVWSAVEQRAGADTTRLLTQHEPPPQTLLRVETNSPDLVVAQFTLSHARVRASDGNPQR